MTKNCRWPLILEGSLWPAETEALSPATTRGWRKPNGHRSGRAIASPGEPLDENQPRLTFCFQPCVQRVVKKMTVWFQNSKGMSQASGHP